MSDIPVTILVNGLFTFEYQGGQTPRSLEKVGKTALSRFFPLFKYPLRCAGYRASK